MVILGQYEWQDPPQRHPLAVANSVILRCGRPVLVVPADARAMTLERIAIAWDGSHEAVRAVHDALPLMHLSRSVEILTMVDPPAVPGEDDVKSLTAHLAHHGIEVSQAFGKS